MTKPIATDLGEVVRREMPVDAQGQAVGATIVVYASGLSRHFAYYASCLTCTERHPFFSPSDRDAWTEMHRTACLDHAVSLTVEPWDYQNPPWIAAYGLPLTADRSTA